MVILVAISRQTHNHILADHSHYLHESGKRNMKHLCCHLASQPPSLRPSLRPHHGAPPRQCHCRRCEAHRHGVATLATRGAGRLLAAAAAKHRRGGGGRC